MFTSEGIEVERTLPAAAYRDPMAYAAEVERIFRREWLLVASSDQIRGPGDYVSLELVGEPIVVVRGTDGVVRALSSVCRHRYMLVAEPGTRGTADCFSCDYHAWRYGLDGRLTAAPFMADAPGFDRADHTLPGFPVEEWDGLIWVCLDPDAEPLAPRLAPLREAFARFGMATARQVAFDDRRWDCNWKVAVENASECYHHLGTHKELLDSVLPARGTYGTAGTAAYAVHHTPATDDADWGIPLDGVESGLLPGDVAETVIYTVFPNALVLNAGPLIGWFSFLPEGPETCRFLNGFLAPAAIADVVEDARIDALMTEINDQDEAIVRLVQRGVRSAYATPGVLSPKEPALVDFYAYLRTTLQDDSGHSSY